MHKWMTVLGATALTMTAAALTGCTHARPTWLADGQRGYSIHCGGWGSDWSTCLTRAGKKCGTHGYEVAYSDEIDRQLIVSCRRETIGADARSTAQSVR